MTGTAGRGALAWHPDLELSKDELDEFLSGRWVARLATTSSSGYPHIAPLWYYWDGVCLFVSLTRNRFSCRNLLRDPRCAVVVDMDVRPTMGLASNLAIAVHLVGDAELTPVAPGEVVRFEGGPWEGERTTIEVMGLISRRYGLWEADGALHGSTDQLIADLRDAESDSRGAADNRDRLVVKIRPRRIRSWDFSRAPFLRER